jgi:chloramphenicol O-acetyltransferase
MEELSKWIKENLSYVEERNGSFTLFHLNRYTGVSVVRSHEGYNKFAQWYIKVNGKIKESREISKREEALYAGYIAFYDLIADKLIEIKKERIKK